MLNYWKVLKAIHGRKKRLRNLTKFYGGIDIKRYIYHAADYILNKSGADYVEIYINKDDQIGRTIVFRNDVLKEDLKNVQF